MKAGAPILPGAADVAKGKPSFAVQMQALQNEGRRAPATASPAMSHAVHRHHAVEVRNTAAAKPGPARKIIAPGKMAEDVETPAPKAPLAITAAVAEMPSAPVVPAPHQGAAESKESVTVVEESEGPRLASLKASSGRAHEDKAARVAGHAGVAVSAHHASAKTGRGATVAPGVSSAAPGVSNAAPGVSSAESGVSSDAPGVSSAASGVSPAVDAGMGTTIVAVDAVTSGVGGLSAGVPAAPKAAEVTAHAAHEVRNDAESGIGTNFGPSAAAGEPRTLVSNAHVLEVGITGGAHGWLRVRAELEHTGEVTASLVASSAGAADALQKELGAMSDYLKSEVVGVSSLAVSALEKGSGVQEFAAQGSASGGTGGAGTGSGASAQQRSGEGAKQFSWGGLSTPASGYSGQAVPSALLGAGVGGWLNVRV